MRLLVTGGAGFIGSYLVDALLDKGYEVVVLDNFSTGSEANLNKAVELFRSDVRIADVLFQAMEGVDYVFHLAAHTLVPYGVNHPEEVLDVNLTGTLRVLQAAADRGVRRVIFASSAAVYGAVDGLLREDGPTRPISTYGASKLSAEILCTIWAHTYGLPTAALRYFNVYGPRMRVLNSEYGLVIPKFLDMMQRGEPPTIYGDGTQTRDYVHVSDIVAANLAVLEYGQRSLVANIASGKSSTVLELVEALNKTLGTDLSPEFLPERMGDMQHTRGSILRAQTDLHWIPRVGLNAGLKTMVKT